MLRYIFLLLLPAALISPAGLLSAQDYSEEIQYLDQYIRKTQQDWKVPGLAIAVVKDGEIILAKGYGKRNQDADDPVDAETIFGIASTTKAMTAAAMGMLVDEGKVKWDDRVVDHWPEFQLYDPYITRELRVRDLFTHNAGLGNADFLWFDSDLTSEEILQRMRFSKPAYPFRGGYTYQNIMYLAAGELIERLSGKSWEFFVQERIFDPLNMYDTYPNQEESKGEANRSTPHYKQNGKIRTIPDSDADAIAPAGAVWSSVADMAVWTKFMLDSARVGRQQLLKPQTYQELLKPQTIVPSAQFYPTTRLTKPNWTTYGLGWFQHDYRGKKLNFHTGSLPGTTAILGFIPEERVGVYLLGNLDHAELRHALMYKVFDLFAFNDRSRDWSTELKALYDDLELTSRTQREKRMSAKMPDTSPSRSLAAYAGTYKDPYYGQVEVVFRDDHLELSISKDMNAVLKHWHYDTFLAQWQEDWRWESFVSFDLSPEGKVTEIAFDGRVLKRN
ncbi:serine hydrolase [Flavilitoribacter nigricans]|uniref:Serine hydrolase n=1 Tax=Flavilitoribacter nigricans (strain ATCC 23147 / DSM 23189 / NBRC 102662 / NCIMB 1420 / SS-2) TaxID=1122177 RepID=A0A2D0NCP4_FLAN2|nr:serine hydrolase [Flavilitoribacter nigricans]PHN05543.1 serine hydrolase [Flavilitoribacter nigricans DSM 23189 = NBRC 102662]